MLNIKVKKPQTASEFLRYYEVNNVLDFLGLQYELQESEEGLDISLYFVKSTVSLPIITLNTITK